MIDHLSASMLGTWLRCGKQFRRRYIEGERIPPGVSARRGSAVHKAAERNYKQKRLTGQDLPLPDLLDACRDEYVRLIRDEGIYFPPEQMPEKASLLNRSLNEALTATTLFRSEIAPKVVPLEAELFVEEALGFGLPVHQRHHERNRTRRDEVTVSLGAASTPPLAGLIDWQSFAQGTPEGNLGRARLQRTPAPRREHISGECSAKLNSICPVHRETSNKRPTAHFSDHTIRR